MPSFSEVQQLAELVLFFFILAAGIAFESNNRNARHFAFLFAMAYVIIMAGVFLIKNKGV